MPDEAMLPPLLARAGEFAGRVAVIDSAGPHGYRELLQASDRIAAALLDGHDDLREQRIAYLIAPGFSWVAVQWGIWRAGGVAVPLPLGAPAPELQYFAEDAQVTALVGDADNGQALGPVAAATGLPAVRCDTLLRHGEAQLPAIAAARRAMILYTSGTTSRPKGVVSTHANIAAQIQSLIEAWEWSQDDSILLCLPLHHVHGIINVLSCALWSGASCRMLPRFDAQTVWEQIAEGSLTLFMAVPTVYARLIAAWEAAPPDARAAWSRGAGRLRLMVSGSAALPVSTLERWKELTGHTLLERYGMTEIGMALSNPYSGERIPGSVGRPLPGVEVRLVDDAGDEVHEGTPGQIEVHGANVFCEYWNRPEATREVFRGRWFRTGDTAVVEKGVYRILGRTNVDILKTGGHKVSALEIEEVLCQHSSVAECAVVGIPDHEWGQRVAVALVLKPDHALDLEGLRLWARERLSNYKVPSRLLVVESLPRNAMGKVTKPAVAELFPKPGPA